MFVWWRFYGNGKDLTAIPPFVPYCFTFNKLSYEDI